MTDTIHNPSAFPRPGSEVPHWSQEGMTLRDWFAGQALAYYARGSTAREATAELAYTMADAMLAERSKTR